MGCPARSSRSSAKVLHRVRRVIHMKDGMVVKVQTSKREASPLVRRIFHSTLREEPEVLWLLVAGGCNNKDNQSISHHD